MWYSHLSALLQRLSRRLSRPATVTALSGDTSPRDHACPACGSQDALSILFLARARVRRVEGCDRAVAPDMNAWNDGNGMACDDCGWQGAAGSARVDRAGESRPSRDPRDFAAALAARTDA